MIILGGRSEPRQIGSLLVFTSGIEATEPDHQVAQSGVVCRSVFGVSGGLIFSEGDISNVVERVFDGPVAPAERLELSGIHFKGGATAENNFGIFGNLNGLEMMSGAANHGGLGRVREPRAFWGDLEGVGLMCFMPAVCLVQSDIRREKKRRSSSWTARRVCRRAWVDWL